MSRHPKYTPSNKIRVLITSEYRARKMSPTAKEMIVRFLGLYRHPFLKAILLINKMFIKEIQTMKAIDSPLSALFNAAPSISGMFVEPRQHSSDCAQDKSIFAVFIFYMYAPGFHDYLPEDRNKQQI